MLKTETHARIGQEKDWICWIGSAMTSNTIPPLKQGFRKRL